MWKKVAKDPSGKEINALAQQIQNFLTPSTPLFFNTLYDHIGKELTSFEEEKKKQKKIEHINDNNQQ